jgi:CheY-like chemotaxis protein
VTASVMPEDRQRVVDAGFDGYQRKPINMKEFMAAVRQTIDQRAGRTVEP